MQLKPHDALEVRGIDCVKGQAVGNGGCGDHGVKGPCLYLAPRASKRGGDATERTCRLGIERQRFEVSFRLLEACLPGSAFVFIVGDEGTYR